MKKSTLNNGIMIIFILILITAKQLRFLPHLNILWNVPYILMGGLLVSGFMFMAYKNKYNYLDIAVIIFNLFLIIPALLSENKALFISIYILPISGYYIFRTQIGNRINIFQLFLIASIIISMLTLSEFVSENYLSSRWFDYESVNLEEIQEGSIYGGNRYDKKFNPILGIIFGEYSILERPLGVAMSPQGSGALIAALALFILSMRGHKHPIANNYKKLIRFAFIISLAALIITLSGTGYIIFFVGSILIIVKGKKRIFLPFILPIILYLSLLIRGYGDQLIRIIKYGHYLWGIFYNNLQENIVSWGIVFGGNQQMTLDIDYFNLLFRFGIIGVILIISIIFIVCKVFWPRLIKTSYCYKPLLPIMLAILVANLHYDSIFRFPMSIMLFMILGYISNQYSLIPAYLNIKNTKIKNV